MNSGHGICGHKNTYNSNVKIGNYVEDQFGEQLSQNIKSHPISKLSESRSHYSNPASKVQQLEPAFNSTVCGGSLPYNMIFSHGKDATIDPNEKDPSRWITTNTTSFCSKSINPLQSNELMREKLKQQAREKRALTSYSTTTKASSKQIS